MERHSQGCSRGEEAAVRPKAEANFSPVNRIENLWAGSLEEEMGGGEGGGGGARGSDTSRSTGRSGRQNAATRRNMRREERTTVEGPVTKQQPDGVSYRGTLALWSSGIPIHPWTRCRHRTAASWSETGAELPGTSLAVIAALRGTPAGVQRHLRHDGDDGDDGRVEGPGHQDADPLREEDLPPLGGPGRGIVRDQRRAVPAPDHVPEGPQEDVLRQHDQERQVGDGGEACGVRHAPVKGGEGHVRAVRQHDDPHGHGQRLRADPVAVHHLGLGRGAEGEVDHHRQKGRERFGGGPQNADDGDFVEALQSGTEDVGRPQNGAPNKRHPSSFLPCGSA